MDCSRARILSSSSRAGIKIDTSSLYCLAMRCSFGFEIKLNSVTVKRSIIKKKVADITIITL